MDYCRKIVNLVINLQTLIESGVPGEDRDDFGDMPIHYAAKSGGFNIIVTLVEMGVQPCVAGMLSLLKLNFYLSLSHL